MVICKNCNKEFPFAWKLRRHLARKIPCNNISNDTPSTANDTPSTANDTSPTANDTSPTANDTMMSEKNRDKLNCKYCNKIFQRVYNKSMHEASCKHYDYVWDLEERCNVPHKLQNALNTCKYCDVKFSRTSSLTRHLQTCKEKQVYKEYLEEKIEIMQQSGKTINNTTIKNINCTTNNVNSHNTYNINVLGKETLDHIDMQRVIDMMLDVRRKLQGETVYVISGQTVIDYHKMIRENESNHNIVVPNERRQIAMVCRNENAPMIKEEINSALDESFRNSSEKLYETMGTIEEQRDGFNHAKTRNIHECVGSFSKRGFKGHPPLPPGIACFNHKKQDINNLTRKFKIANISKEND